MIQVSISPFVALRDEGGSSDALARQHPQGVGQTRSGPRADQSAAVIPASRRSAVIPTAMAPMLEKTACQVGDGIVSRTIP